MKLVRTSQRQLAGTLSPKWPDWTNSAEYPAPKELSYKQWAWEFLRRNESYQRDYLVVLACHSLGSNPTEDQRDYEIERGSEVPVDCFNEVIEYKKIPNAYPLELQRAARYGLRAIMVDPALDAKAARMDNLCFAALWYPMAFGWRESDKCEPTIEDGEIWYKCNFPVWFRPSLPSEVAFTFDARYSLEAQWESAKRVLQAKQKELSLAGMRQKTKSAPQPHLFPLYVRLLDAMRDGAPPKQIREVLYPEVKRTTAAWRTKNSNHKKAAFNLRDEGYKEIAALQPRV